jgi:hypothetical protein
MAEKKKRKHKGLIIFLTIVLIVIVLPISLVYGLFFDSSTKDVKKDENFTMEKFGETIIVDSLDFASLEDHKISFQIKEEYLNQALLLASEDMDPTLSKYLKKIYVDFQEDCYKFYIDLEVPLFKTRACLITKLESNSEGFAFIIKDVKVGRLGGFYWVLEKFVDDSMLNDIFASTGLSIKADIENHQLTYSLNSLIHDLKNMGVIETGSFFFKMMSDFLSNEQLVSYDFYSNDSMSIDIDLTKLHQNQFVDANYDLNLDLLAIKNATETHINNNPTFTKTTDNIQSFFEQTFRNTYASKLTGHKSIKNIAIEQINAAQLTSVGDSVNVVIQEKEINDYFSISEIIGDTVIFHRDTTTGHKVNFVTIDNFYTNMYKDSTGSYADFVIGLNISGYETVATIETKLVTTSGTTMEFEFTEHAFNFGAVELDGELKNSFIDYLSTGLSHSEDSTIKLSNDKQSIIVDFADAISDSIYSTIIKNHCNVACNIFGNNLQTTEAGLEINISFQ